jgi:hypothetical protein
MVQATVARRRAAASGDPEDVACWFFRLNGCLTIRDFILHPDRRGSQRTDADVLALRFPWRTEQDMVDHQMFRHLERPTLFLTEVKSAGLCRLNGPWTDRAAGNVGRVLTAIGCYQDAEAGRAAEALYGPGSYRGSHVDASLVAVAEHESDELAHAAPSTVQLVWDDIFAFILERFRLYRAQKAHHPQWDGAAQSLYRMATRPHMELDQFRTVVRQAFFAGGDSVGGGRSN